MIPDDLGAEPESTATLFASLYGELKRIAHLRLRAVDGHSLLCTTELVHEVFLKLERAGDLAWAGRAHFFGTASRAMRHVLVDFARRRGAAKRAGAWRRVSLGAADASLQIELEQLLDLDAALDRLDAVDPRLRRVVELRFFGGLPEEEIAQLLGVTDRTIRRDWLKARLLLLRELERPAAGDAAE